MAQAAVTWTMGERMEKARRAARISVGEMAARQGVAAKTINNWEKGRTHPKRAVLELWASATGFPFEWLLYGDAWSDQDLKLSRGMTRAALDLAA